MKEYIEREAAIKEVAKWLADVFGIKSESGAGTLFKKLRSIPAADVVEVKHGKFEGRVFNTIWRIQSCSECKEYVPQGNYCSNCGAKMDGGVNDAAD